MDKDSKIINNPSSKEIIEQMRTFNNIEDLYHLIPFFKKHFPNLESVFSDISNLNEQAHILFVPDQFNEIFSEHGWIAYENMRIGVMKAAIDLQKSEGLQRAEEYLANAYDEETLKWGLLRFNGNPDFRKRIRLVELAKEDYISGRYHACIPLLLSLLDGLVNDINKHVGFFAENVDLIAWDSIAAHETGLQALHSIFTKGRNKTNEDPISIPYRNGILHGRELAFDNKIVAAKCWAALFAARDWADALDGKKEPKPKEDVSWEQLFKQIAETTLRKKSIEEWQPRNPEDIKYLPFEGVVSNLPENTPEWAVGIFLDHWCNERFGPLAGALLNYTDTPEGKRAGTARKDFGKHVPVSFKLLAADDQTPAITNVRAELHFKVDGQIKSKEISISTIYHDLKNDLSIRSMPDGHWRIVQNSFADIIYSPSL